MMVLLSDIQAVISASERARLQRLLSIILPHADTKALPHFAHFIQESYGRLGPPSEWLRQRQLMPSFKKLLDSFGFLPAKNLNSKEKEQLLNNPYVIWLDQNYCLLNGDALAILIEDKELKKQNYLCFLLQKLSNCDIQAWCQWLGLDISVPSRQARTFFLYRHLACLHNQQKLDNPSLRQTSCFTNIPNFLDEVFPDDPSYSPLSWFYRDVFSFYRALQETEKKLESLPQAAKLLIALFKSGRLVVVPAPAKLGQPTRFRIIVTKEKDFHLHEIDNVLASQAFPVEKEEHQKMLF